MGLLLAAVFILLLLVLTLGAALAQLPPIRGRKAKEVRAVAWRHPANQPELDFPLGPRGPYEGDLPPIEERCH